MKFCMIIPASLVFVFIILIGISCSNPNSTPNNSKPIDSMVAEIHGDLELEFNTSAVNVMVFPKDSNQIIQISGTVLGGPFEVYTMYFAFLDDGSGNTQFGLDSTETFTRFEYTLGATTEKLMYLRNLEGNLSLTQNTKNTLSGNFNFRVTLIDDTTKYIDIKNGIFYYTTDN